mgnify:CR=1 FL=1
MIISDYALEIKQSGFSVYEQMRCFIKHILIDEKACDYYKNTYPFIEQYGFPAYIDSTDHKHIKISKPNDNVLDLQIQVARITNEIGLTHFNIIE